MDLAQITPEQIGKMSKDELNALKIQLKNIVSEFGTKEKVFKIMNNSGFGVMAQPGFMFFDVHLAMSVTLSGQLVINWAKTRLNEYLNKILVTDKIDYVIYADTDSLGVDMEPVVHKFCPNPTDKQKVCDFLDVVSGRVQKMFEKSFDELRETLNCPRQEMYMKREAIADMGVFLAKKNYIMNVLDMEGVRFAKPEIKAVGIASVKSSTPSSCRSKISECIELIFTKTEDDVVAFIEKFRKDFPKCSLDEAAFPRGVSDVGKYRVGSSWDPRSATPQNVKAALAHNKLIEKLGLENQYPLIRDGDKIKFMKLRVPNMVGTDVIGFLNDRMPPEFDMEKYIDWDAQFEAAFLTPVKAILDIMGWKTEESINLELFS